MNALSATAAPTGGTSAATPDLAAIKTAPAGHLGERRLPHDRDADPDRLRAPHRGARRPLDRARPRRRDRQRQRCPRRCAPRLYGRRHRLRPGAARPGASARRRRGRSTPTFIEGDAEALPVRRRPVRRRQLGLRGDVRAGPGADRERARAGHAVRRPDRPRRAHARGLHRPAVQDESRGTSRRRPGLRSPVQWGTEERLRELFGDAIAELRVEKRHYVFRVPLAGGATSTTGGATTARR